jgi:DNA-binding NtrC family response regulator
MVLFVDDDICLQESIQFILELNGYEVTTLDSGNAAIDWLKKDNDCDLIITDIHMKNGSGIDLITWIQGQEKEIPIVIITGDSLAAVIEEAKQFSEIMRLPVINKPFTTKKFLGIVRSIYKPQPNIDSQIKPA